MFNNTLRKAVRYFYGEEPRDEKPSDWKTKNSDDEDDGFVTFCRTDNFTDTDTDTDTDADIDEQTPPLISSAQTPFEKYLSMMRIDISASRYMFHKDGIIDEGEWNALTRHARIGPDNTPIIYQQACVKFFNSKAAEGGKPNCCCRLFGETKKINEEWPIYFELFGKTDLKGQQYIKISDLRKLYEDADKYTQQAQVRNITRKTA